MEGPIPSELSQLSDLGELRSNSVTYKIDYDGFLPHAS